jgi:serine/threonine protein kinase
MLLEYVCGDTLAEELRRDEVSEARALCVAQQVLCALSHLHAYGGIHGDINPTNVLVSAHNGECKLSDYFAECPRPAAPAYMAPEAAREKTVSLSDVWSVGCLMLRLEGLQPWQHAKVLLLDGSSVDLSSTAALLYHLATRDVAMDGPPERLLSRVFPELLRCIFAPPDHRASACELLCHRTWCCEREKPVY